MSSLIFMALAGPALAGKWGSRPTGGSSTNSDSGAGYCYDPKNMSKYWYEVCY